MTETASFPWLDTALSPRERAEKLVAGQQVQRAEAARLLDGGHGRFGAFFAVEGDGGADVDIGHAVAVGHAESLAAKIWGDPFQPTAGHRVLSGSSGTASPGDPGSRRADRPDAPPSAAASSPAARNPTCRSRTAPR